MRRWVSLGGWCGPSLMLAKLGVVPTHDPLPFDSVRSTFDGVVQFTTKGFTRDGGYLPGSLASRPFPMDPVGVWLLFRSPHICFTHLDINRDEILGVIRDRMRAWERLLTPRDHATFRDATNPQERLPITFIRTVVAENPEDELRLLPSFHAAVRARTRGTVPFRTVMVLHDQGPTTRPLFTFGEESAQYGTPCVVWNLKRELPAESSETRVSLLDQCHSGYQEIITSMAKEMRWRALETSLPNSLEAYAALTSRTDDASRLFTPYTSLSLIRGVPAFRGTCKGFCSTLSVAAGKCVHCGSEDGHAIEPSAFDTHKAWSDEDVNQLLLAYALNEGDSVAATEAAAVAQGRGAHETYQKLRDVVGDDE